MSIYLRWFNLLLTCGLGRHAKSEVSKLPGNVLYHECPRCHAAHYERFDQPKGNVIHLRPSLWDVARGKYDRGIQE